MRVAADPAGPPGARPPRAGRGWARCRPHAVGGDGLGEAPQLRAGAGADVDDRLPRLRRERLERPVAQAPDRRLLLLRVEERDEGGDAGRAALTDPLRA